MKKIISIIAISCFSFSVCALETDNYLAWKVDLTDSADDANAFVAETIQEGLDNAAAKGKTSCEDVTMEIAKLFRCAFGNKRFEEWANAQSPDKTYPHDTRYITDSIYHSAFRFHFLRLSGLSPNININGYYLGTDKLSHFSSTGRRYFGRYLKNLAKGMSEEEAMNKALKFGISSEGGFLGLKSSGMMSFGDLEANFQGLLFYRRMCLDKTSPYLEKTVTGWSLKQKPDMRDYVSPYWDETYNLSYRSEREWKRAAPHVQADYCPLKDSERVQQRFAYYRKYTQKSYSLNYIEGLQKEGLLPIPAKVQSFNELCQPLNAEVKPEK